MPATASYQPAFSSFRPSANTGATSARDYWCIGKDKIVVPNLNGHMRDFIGSFHHALPEDHKVINLESYRNFQTESPLVLEIYDLAKDADQDIVPDYDSISYAVKFAKVAAEAIKFQPIIDLHPDGEISFTWRRAKNGIINISFRKEGIATYASFLAASEETHKGRFKVNGSIPSTLLHLIHQIEKA